MKKKLTNAETLGYFDTEAKTQLVTEASPVSLEFALLQIQNGENELSQNASRSLTDVEKRYFQTDVIWHNMDMWTFSYVPLWNRLWISYRS